MQLPDPIDVPSSDDLACAFSRAIGEPLYGTMKPANRWLLIENNHVWGSDALAESDLPDEIRAWDELPDTKVLFIKQPGQPRNDDFALQLYIVQTPASRPPRIVSLQRETYDAFIGIDLDAPLENDGASLYEGALYCVCAHATRDLCCARYGVPLYRELMQRAGDQVWQSSHIGGHRLAATMLCFPSALCYGMLNPADAATIIEHTRNSTVWLDKLRGRAVYDKPTQAAEYFLRQHLTENHDGALIWHGTLDSEGGWLSLFQHRGARYAVRISPGEELMVMPNSNSDERKGMPQFVLQDIAQQEK